jgi:signal transduction histidine kinase/CheY-like chemotaxis protein
LFVAEAPSGRGIYVNRAGEELLGVSISDSGIADYSRAYSVYRASGEPYPPEELPLSRAIREGGTWAADDIWIRREDHEVPLRATATALQDETGRITHGVALFENYSMQHRLVQAEKLAALGDLARGMAHNFNNALTVILGTTQLALDVPELPEAAREYLQIVEAAATEVAATVRLIHQFGRQRPARETAPVDLNQLARETMELTRTQWRDEAHARGITIDFRLELGDVPIVAGNAGQMRQALLNLTQNALQAMPEGGTLRITTDADEESVFATVTDAGVGMDEATRRRIFDPFFTTRPVGEGTGLGLSVAYGIVRQHGGSITVTSQIGAGSSFTISLPHVEPAVEGADLGPSGARRRLDVLVIDDDDGVRRLTSSVLEQAGHRVMTSASGDEGLQAFDRGQFDLVITDQGMPGMRGTEVARGIKALRSDARVVLLTGWGSDLPGDLTEEELSAVDLILAKPLRNAELLQAVARLSP